MQLCLWLGAAQRATCAISVLRDCYRTGKQTALQPQPRVDDEAIV